VGNSETSSAQSPNEETKTPEPALLDTQNFVVRAALKKEREGGRRIPSSSVTGLATIFLRIRGPVADVFRSVFPPVQRLRVCSDFVFVFRRAGRQVPSFPVIDRRTGFGIREPMAGITSQCILFGQSHRVFRRKRSIGSSRHLQHGGSHPFFSRASIFRKGIDH